MIECVPNFSEGRDASAMLAIIRQIESVSGIMLLGWESDEDHNRSVVTFAGPEDAVLEGAIRGAGAAAERIDLRRHQGVHPRVGAADVIPFVPLENSNLEDCVRVAHRAGAEIWRRFGIPSYFYESAALSPNRRRLENVRRREFDGKPPDVGDVAAHPTAGACVIGARDFLIAFNVNLVTPDASVAQAIARKIRESSGGFPFVKAMGRYLRSRNCAQVSINFTNFAQTPLEDVYATIAAEASVASCQLVGLIPRRAFEMSPEFFRRAQNFDESRVIENRIATIKASAG